MKTFDPATTAYLVRRAGNVARVLVHVWAANRNTGLIERLGLWSGDQDREFLIEGEMRQYVRAAGLIQMDEIISQPGTDVIFSQLSLTTVDPAIWGIVQTYDLRFAAVEVHRALFDADSGSLISEPHRLLKGWIDKAPMPLPEAGGDAQMHISIASANRGLTRTLPFMKSDPALQAARSGTRFRRYTDVGTVTAHWGEARVGGA